MENINETMNNAECDAVVRQSLFLHWNSFLVLLFRMVDLDLIRNKERKQCKWLLVEVVFKQNKKGCN